MCLAVPTQVVEIIDDCMIRVRIGNSPTTITASSLLLPEPPKLGDYLIVHAGFAMQKLDPDRARDSLAAFKEISDTV